MDRAPQKVGSLVHVFTRGSRGLPITKQESDRWRFLWLLYFLNDKNRPAENWKRDVKAIQDGFHFKRPSHWPPREKLVDILAYCLMDNHYHLLLYQREEDGIRSFIRRLNSSMANHFKDNYDESGLLDTPYQSRLVEDQNYFDIVFFYINIKNPFERFPNGYRAAVKNFDAAYEHAAEYEFCSLPDYDSKNGWPLVSREVVKKFIDSENLKETAKDYIMNRSVFRNPHKQLQNLLIDH